MTKIRTFNLFIMAGLALLAFAVLPLMVWATVSADSEGDARLQLAKRLQVTPRLGIWGEVFYDTGTRWEWTAGADYTLTRHTSLTASYHSDYGLGAGVLIRF